MKNEVISINDNGKIEINAENVKSKPRLVWLIKKIQEYRIDIDTLTENEINELMACILIADR